MSEIDAKYHEAWIGLVQPIDGLVVSVPVLVDANCVNRQPPAVTQTLLDLCVPVDRAGHLTIRSFPAFLENLLGWTPDLYDIGDALPQELSLYVPEGGQTLRPTLALRHLTPPPEPTGAEVTPASRAGSRYVALVWAVPHTVKLDSPETTTGLWDYPAASKFDRLLRACRVPIGVLTNHREVRLVYAPHGESSGSITFRLDDMATPSGRPILEALIMLLGTTRFFAVARQLQLPALLEESRQRQANVTNDLADQVFEAVEILLRAFEDAAERDGRQLLDEALARGHDALYGGLLTVLLRLVFLLYAEDQGLLPTEHPLYANHLSVLGLFSQLQADAGTFPDAMSRRFGAYARLVALFRAVYLGVEHEGLRLPPRQGQLFNPHLHPFLEGWDGPSAPIVDPAARAATRVPSIDDESVYGVLQKLLFLDRQRLSYRALDVEQIGSVYERLMGYHVLRVDAPAVCLKPSRVWLTAREVAEVPAARRAKWLQETTALAKARAEKLADALESAPSDESDEAILEALEGERVRNTQRAQAGRLVIQPGAERRRTSSHYTPRSLTAPIVRRTLEPLLAAMGPNPPSERILNLKICDPAMGSGAFLVEACRFLGDQLVAAWTREGQQEVTGSRSEDAVLRARRLVAQRCLYGVDKNPFAVNLAKLSLWLVTLAKELPFTFLDHALRHGDSLVGLDFEQIKAFHWKPEKQLAFVEKELGEVLETAIGSRQRIIDLAKDGSPEAQAEKKRLLLDAEDALDHVRLIADLVVGAFFSATKDKEREAERKRRLGAVEQWLNSGEPAVPEALRQLQAQIQERTAPFHWMAEFPEVFWVKRPDPLADDAVNGDAWMDAFVGNPPFVGGKRISSEFGEEYADWLAILHGTTKNADISAQFFRRAAALLGSNGTFGLVATNTIAQGDTRAAGLQYLVGHGDIIYDATESMPWPGDAAVVVSVAHVARGRLFRGAIDVRLDGRRVDVVNSRLLSKPERSDVVPLNANRELSFIGNYVHGLGFVLSPEEKDQFTTDSHKNKEVIRPYLGGEEVNTSPTQAFDRYVIDFGNMSLTEASEWPGPMGRVRQLVKPERDRANRASIRDHWWQFAEKQPAMRAAIKPLHRCLVTSIVTKHLIFSFQPTNRVLAHKLCIFPFDNHSPFATMQSRVHIPWAWLLSSTMKEDLNYSASDCFETFPFPQSDPRTVIPALEESGQRLYEARAKYMVETQQGLTKTYNRLKDPACTEPRVAELRALHEAMDRAVLEAYGWGDIEVPPYVTPTTDAQRAALEAFEDEVIDRLFQLNARRAEEERLGAVFVKPEAKKGVRKRKQEDQGELL